MTCDSARQTLRPTPSTWDGSQITEKPASVTTSTTGTSSAIRHDSALCRQLGGGVDTVRPASEVKVGMPSVTALAWCWSAASIWAILSLAS